MSALEIIYWVLMGLALLVGGILRYRDKDVNATATGLIAWLLFLVLGLAKFGPH